MSTLASRDPATGRLLAIPVAERFWDKVAKAGPTDCWPWRGSSTNGYGRLHIAGRRSEAAHRIAYELLVGPIPEGLTLDHLCRNRACCNPAHLEPVTNRENVLRGTGPSARAARATHCPKGHEYTSENTRSGRYGRHCRTCEKAMKLIYRTVHRDRVKSSQERWRTKTLAAALRDKAR